MNMIPLAALAAVLASQFSAAIQAVRMIGQLYGLPTSEAKSRADDVLRRIDLTDAADRILDDNGVFVVPDILANAGGVTVSYFEWVQDFNRDQWSEEVVNSKLTAIMVRSFGEVVAMADREEVDMRTAAYLLAVDRVAKATELRGLYP